MEHYFKSLRFWYVDVICGYLFACLVTPADPLSALIVFVPLMAIWLPFRFFLSRRFSRR